MTFEGPEAPGHAPGGSLCSKGSLDRFWERFWEPNGRPKGLYVLQGQPGSILATILGAKWEAKGAKMPPKIDLKIDEIWSMFLMEISANLGGYSCRRARRRVQVVTDQRGQGRNSCRRARRRV